MTEERITRVETPSGNTHTTTTILSDEPKRGKSGIFLFILLAIVAIVAIVVFTQMGGAEVAKDNAVADAANQVGETAQQVGDAVEGAAEELTGDQ